MTDFGWSYPAGVSSVPGDEPVVCWWCGLEDWHWPKNWEEEWGYDGERYFCSPRHSIHNFQGLERQHNALTKLLNSWTSPKERTLTIESLFRATPEGDFKWEDEIGNDEVPWSCDDTDCPSPWHAGTSYTNMGRKGGKKYIEILYDSHSDGDAQPYLYWEEGQNPQEILAHLENELDSFFLWWATYWLDCYQLGYDPLKELILPEEGEGAFKATCLNNAREDILYLWQIWQPIEVD